MGICLLRLSQSSRQYCQRSLSQTARKPAFPIIPDAQNTVLAVVVTATIVTSRVAENGREEPESRGCPRSNCDAESNDGREKADDDEHGHAVALRRIERVDQMELQIECGGQKGLELSGQRRTVAAEAQGVDCKRDEDGKDGPESDCDG